MDSSTVAVARWTGQSGAMSDHDDLSARWHDAAARASFAFYEPSNGSDRWAGGFASDGTQIEVIAVVGGDRVSVETSRPKRAIPDATRRRFTIADLLWRHTLNGDAELTLPHSVTVEADDRAVTVENETHTADGMRIEGDPNWVGTMQLGDVTVKITTASPSALSLRPCTDASSLPEVPPWPR
jgi:hypothetical protein